jgi:REP element-mobilizing transposase RayT
MIADLTGLRDPSGLMSDSPSLEPGHYDHIYNRGNNRENIFVEERNYVYFLKLYANHIEPIAETFAYCLLRNHFHFLIRLKDDTRLDPSQQFSNLFNAYAKAINRAYGRTGALFQRPFGRVCVTSDQHFIRLVTYIHRNPQ